MKNLSLALIFVFTLAIFSAYAEEVEITTYYPAPSGVYKDLAAQVYYDYDDPAYHDTGADYFLDPYPDPNIPGPGNDVSLTVKGKVGIGTTAPDAKLQVEWAPPPDYWGNNPLGLLCLKNTQTAPSITMLTTSNMTPDPGSSAIPVIWRMRDNDSDSNAWQIKALAAQAPAPDPYGYFTIERKLNNDYLSSLSINYNNGDVKIGEPSGVFTWGKVVIKQDSMLNMGMNIYGPGIALEGGTENPQGGTSRMIIGIHDQGNTTTPGAFYAVIGSAYDNFPDSTGRPLILNPGYQFGTQTSTPGNVGIGTTAPNSMLHINGPIATAFVTKGVAYTITETDSIVFSTSTLAAPAGITFTLPTAAGIAGRQYTIIRKTPGNVILACYGAQTINSSPTLNMQQYFLGAVTVVSDGANWFISSSHGG